MGFVAVEEGVARVKHQMFDCLSKLEGGSVIAAMALVCYWVGCGIDGLLYLLPFLRYP